jgi:hypothetical protein
MGEVYRAQDTRLERTIAPDFYLLSLRETYVTDDLRSYAYTAYYRVSSLFVSDARK